MLSWAARLSLVPAVFVFGVCLWALPGHVVTAAGQANITAASASNGGSVFVEGNDPRAGERLPAATTDPLDPSPVAALTPAVLVPLLIALDVAAVGGLLFALRRRPLP